MGTYGTFVKINFVLRYNSFMEKLLAHFKTQTALADALNSFLQTERFKTAHVYYWKKNGLPPKLAITIEKMTDGLFNRRLLCPHFFDQ